MYTRRVRTEYADWEIAGRYRLEEPIGKGGMGSVWRARHLSLDAPVAVKLIDPALARDDEARTRFLREARAAAALRSPNVVQTFDFGVEDGVPFIVMELLQGETLEDRLARSAPLSPEETVDIMVQVSRAIAKAHEHGIIHRDLKPDNIFLTEHDDEWVVKVLDFGVAKFTGGDMPAGAATRPGAVLGTPFYMSPEQAEGKRPLDWRADLWSLAVLTFECVVGVRPFQGDTAAILFVQLVAAPIPVPSRYAKVPPGFDEWWAQAAQRDPELRFQNAKEQAESLCAALGVQRRTSLFSVTGEHPIVFAAVEAKVRARRAAAAANGPPSAPRLSTPAHDVPNEDSGVQPQSFRGADDSGAYLAASGVTDKPMVWIPPIELIGDSPDLRALADGLAEDIRVGIGLHRSLRVTDSSTRGPAHAHFIAKSALQGHASRLRLSVRLEDGATKEQFWSQRYERDGGDPFEVQDALTRLVVSGLWTALRVRLAEELRFIDNSQLSVPQLLDKAAGLFARSVGEGDIAEDALRRVIAIEPRERHGARHARVCAVPGERSQPGAPERSAQARNVDAGVARGRARRQSRRPPRDESDDPTRVPLRTERHPRARAGRSRAQPGVSPLLRHGGHHADSQRPHRRGVAKARRGHRPQAQRRQPGAAPTRACHRALPPGRCRQGD